MSQAEGHDQDSAGGAGRKEWLSTATWWFGEGLWNTMTGVKLSWCVQSSSRWGYEYSSSCFLWIITKMTNNYIFIIRITPLNIFPANFHSLKASREEVIQKSGQFCRCPEVQNTTANQKSWAQTRTIHVTWGYLTFLFWLMSCVFWYAFVFFALQGHRAIQNQHGTRPETKYPPNLSQLFTREKQFLNQIFQSAFQKSHKSAPEVI